MYLFQRGLANCYKPGLKLQNLASYYSGLDLHELLEKVLCTACARQTAVNCRQETS